MIKRNRWKSQVVSMGIKGIIIFLLSWRKRTCRVAFGWIQYSKYKDTRQARAEHGHGNTNSRVHVSRLLASISRATPVCRSARMTCCPVSSVYTFFRFVYFWLSKWRPNWLDRYRIEFKSLLINVNVKKWTAHIEYIVIAVFNSLAVGYIILFSVVMHIALGISQFVNARA